MFSSFFYLLGRIMARRRATRNQSPEKSIFSFFYFRMFLPPCRLNFHLFTSKMAIGRKIVRRPAASFFFCRFLQVRLFPILPHSRVRARESCPPTKSSHPSTLATAIVPHATCVCTFSAAQPFGPFGGVSLAACEWTFDSEYMLVTVANVVWGCFQ